MASITFNNGRKVGDYLNPYIVAELNTSHFGDLDLARSMISEAKMVGCDCVKFQSWSPESLYSSSYYKENKIAKRFVSKFALNESDFLDLAKYCDAIGIDFASTPYALSEAEFLVKECKVPFIKIASMELNNLSYLRSLSKLEVPLVLSTGMGTIEEIISAVRAIENEGNSNIVILHCISNYPVPIESVRLNNIIGLRSEFPQYPIGYSDHSIGGEISIAAVALGASLIEKHFTLDATRIGMDNQMATEPTVMREMISSCRNVQSALGGSNRILDELELAQIPKMRRSVVAARPLVAGQTIALEDLDFKRPGYGIPPTKISSLIGRRILVDLDREDMLSYDQFEEK